MEYEWTQKRQEAFDTLKERLVTAPILVHPEFAKPFLLYTDACGIGLGGVFAQKGEDERERAIAYISRHLKPAEMNYSTIEKEALAIVWAIGKFRSYLYGKPFTVATDHAPLLQQTVLLAV